MNRKENILLDAQLRDVIDRNAFRAILKNGYELIAFRVEQDQELQDCSIGEFVKVEVSPFDMSKGRIINKIGTEQ